MLCRNMIRTIMLRSRMPLAAGCLALAGCSQPVSTPVASQGTQNIKADVVDWGMTSVLTAQGVKQGEIRADTAYLFNDSSLWKLRGMRVTFYGDNGQERAEVTADRGEIHTNSERMEAYGHVVLVIPAQGPSVPARTIHTSQLDYDPDRGPSGQIWSDSATVMIQGSDTTRGTAFRSDLDFKNVQVRNPRGAVGGGVF